MYSSLDWLLGWRLCWTYYFELLMSFKLSHEAFSSGDHHPLTPSTYPPPTHAQKLLVTPKAPLTALLSPLLHPTHTPTFGPTPLH